VIGARSCRRPAPVAGLLSAVLLAGCASTAPSPTPADTQVIFEELARRGATVTSIVSGDPGCDEPQLVDNAVSFDLLGPEHEAPVRVHLLIFRNAAAYDAAAKALSACYRSRSGMVGTSQVRIESSPYWVLARGLSEADRQLIEEALEALR
jgi:hypothetical protein